MRGHVRKRGDPGTWEYIVDVGMHDAQRCPACKKRFWVERSPKTSCPKCGGELTETERAPPCDQGRLRHAEGVPGGDEQAPGRRRAADLPAADQDDRQGVPHQGVAAGGQGDHPPLHLQLLRAARRVPHRAAHRRREAREAHRQPGQRPLREARRDRQEERQEGPLTHDHQPRPRLPAQGVQGRGQVGLHRTQPARCRRPAARQR